MSAAKNRKKKTATAPVAKGKAKKGRAGLGMNNTWTDEPPAPEETTLVESATAEAAAPEPAEPAPAEPPVASPPAPTIEADAPGKKLSALDAAVRVLAEEGRPMNCQELIDAIAAKDYWQSPGGKTPAATLYSAILREQKIRGDQARFAKTDRGKFTRVR